MEWRRCAELPAAITTASAISGDVYRHLAADPYPRDHEVR